MKDQIKKLTRCNDDQADKLQTIILHEPVISYHPLMKAGLTITKAVILFSALSLGKEIQSYSPTVKYIKCSLDVYNIMRSLVGPLEHEEFWVLLLNRKNKVIDKVKISQGGIAGTVVDIRLILNTAITHLASAIILCHNHPSGNTEPSSGDKLITEKIQAAAKYMDINVLDHIIVGDRYFSFADESLM